MGLDAAAGDEYQQVEVGAVQRGLAETCSGLRSASPRSMTGATRSEVASGMTIGASRGAAGATDVAVLRDADNPNSVWMVVEGDPAIVERMMSDPERGVQMQAAGVLSPPQVWVS